MCSEEKLLMQLSIVQAQGALIEIIASAVDGLHDLSMEFPAWVGPWIAGMSAATTKKRLEVIKKLKGLPE